MAFIPSTQITSDYYQSSDTVNKLSCATLNVSGATTLTGAVTAGTITATTVKTNNLSIVATGLPSSRSGFTTLIAGASTFTNVTLGALDSIVLGSIAPAATSGALYVFARTNGVAGTFTIKSTNVADTSVVSYQIISQV